MKYILIVVLVSALLVGMVAVKSFLRFQKEEQAMHVFDPYLDEYFGVEIATGADPSQPYIKGGLLTLDIDTKTVDYFTFPKLKDDIKAKNPEEVGTVVIITWGEIKEGDYVDENGTKIGEAFRSTALLSIIDWEKKTEVGKKFIPGQAPLKSHRLGRDFKSAQPMFKVVEYLEALPRQ